MAMTEWFDRAFGRWYPVLYPHRNLEEARRLWSWLAAYLPGPGPYLEAGCGAGRHLKALQESGFTVVGLDRSSALLAEARKSVPGFILRGDMRCLPVPPAAVHGVLSLFTSFGYFQTAAAHSRLLVEFSRATKSGGILILDYLNAASLEASLVPRSVRQAGGATVVEERWIETQEALERVNKRLSIYQNDHLEESYMESVAVFSREAVTQMLEESGWHVSHAFGDYQGSPWSPDTPRLLLVGRKP